MARIKNIELPKEKSIQTGLTHIYGIGRSLAKTICDNANVDYEKKVKDLTEDNDIFIDTIGSFFGINILNIIRKNIKNK